MLKSDLVFMTKTGLQQLEEVIEGRTANRYKNRKVPAQEELPYKQYIGSHQSRRQYRKERVYKEIIKPVLEHEDLVGVEDRQLEIFTPAVQKYL